MFGPEAAAQSVSVLSFDSSTYSVAENAGTVSVTVNASTAPGSALTVNLESAHVTMDQHDYTAAETFTFPANRTSHSFTVDILDDTFYENAETFTLTLEHGSGYTVGSPESTTVTINDDDRIAVRINLATYAVAEDAGRVVLTIEAGYGGGVPQGNNDVPISLTLTPSDGTATGGSGGTGSGVDYDSDAINFMIRGGISSVYVPVPITDDSDAEWDETFTVALTTGQSRVDVVSPSTTTVTITNDDVPPPRVSLHARDSIAREGGSDSATMALRLSRALDSGETLTVAYSLNLNAGASVSGTGVMLSSHTSGATSTGTLTITGPSAPTNKQDVRLQLNAAANTVNGSASGIRTADFELTSVTGITGVGFVSGETSAKVFVKESSLSGGHNTGFQVFGGEPFGSGSVGEGGRVTVLLPGGVGLKAPPQPPYSVGYSKGYTVTLGVQNLTTDFDDLGRAYAGHYAVVAKPRRDTASSTDYYSVYVLGRGKPAFVHIPVTDQSDAESHERFRVFIAETPDYMGVTGVPNSLNRAPSVDFTIRGSLGNPSPIPPVPSDPAPASAGTQLYADCASYLPTDAVSVGEVKRWRYTRRYYAPHALRWDRVLAALGVDTGEAALTARESKANERQFLQERWERVTRTLEGLELCVTAQNQGRCPEGQTEEGENDDGSPICGITVRPTDYAALKALYDATGGPDWKDDTNWLSVRSLDQWHGVRIASAGNNAGRVFLLDLRDNGLSGTIPPQLADLSALSTELDLSQNQLTGHIPSELSTLTNLNHLDLSGNRLTGNIPAEFGDWTVIHNLYLQDNRLSGTLPAELTNIPFGSHLHLDVRNNAGICAPADAAFQTWLQGIGESHGCGFPTHEDDHDEDDHLTNIGNRNRASARQGTEPESGLEAVPKLSLSAGAAVDEGASATFTVNANPAPASDLTVQLNIAQNGDFATAGATGSKTVTVSASGSATLTIATVDDNADEPDGSISVTINAGEGYTAAAAPNDTASVTVRDNDDPPPASSCVSDAKWNTVKGYYASNSTKDPNYGANWYRVLIAYQRERADKTLPAWTGATAKPTTPYTVKEAETGESVWGGWKPITDVLRCLGESEPEAVPELSLSAGAAVDEGTSATFTVNANPAPASDLTVQLNIAQNGDFATAGATGTKTVTVSASGSATLTVATVDDNADEPDGSISVTINAGEGYTAAAAPNDTASVTVRDNDDPPPASSCVSDAKWNTVEGYYTSNSTKDPNYGANWYRVLIAYQRERTDKTLPDWVGATAKPSTPYTFAEAQESERVWQGWKPITDVLQCLMDVSVISQAFAPLMPSSSNPMHDGVVRFVNRSPQAGEVQIQPTDDAGWSPEPVTLHIGPGESVHLTTRDLEWGNAAKGLTGTIGPGTGAWRLDVSSEQDIQVLPYVRAYDGLLAPMHAIAESAQGLHRVPTFNPASSPADRTGQASMLRLVNRGDEALTARITGMDDGGMAGGEVTLDIRARESVLLTAAELESGAAGLRGALGDGRGMWRLSIASGGDLAVMNLLQSSDGHLTNLSGDASPALRSEGVHAVPYFPSASDVLGRQGLVRIVNDTAANVPVRVQSYDDRGRRYAPLSLALGAGEAVHLNSWDLELGNASGGLSGSTGAGMGDWRLEIASKPGVEVLAYVRTQTGSLTPMHEVVNESGQRYELAMFNPAGDTAPAGKLRIVNPGRLASQVLIRGTDDSGTLSRDVVWLTVGAGESRVIEAAQLETGHGMQGGVHGALGDGAGEWRLAVESDQPILLMNLAESHNGHITNLSSVAEEAVANGKR